jgi:acyl-[acyl-carrier-protein]-phospholipid O-acyltransferase/long-chain-fatty-acid--[acyl-carrier-protein] ligase
MMDEDGFVFITDRLSRFNKIGGEMVPHLKIEEAIAAVIEHWLRGDGRARYDAR